MLEAGLCPVPCRDGKPVCAASTTESGVRGWSNQYPDALETGIYDRRTGEVTIVTEVPPGPAQLAAQRRSERKARERTKNRQRKEGKRRAEGAMPRSEWLAAHRIPAWAGSGMSKSAFYRARKVGKGVAGA